MNSRIKYSGSFLIALILAGCARGGNEIRRTDTGMKVLVIGIDGGSWRIMRPMMEKGELPNLKRLADGGVSASLESEKPFFSPAIWTTIATGLGPDRHGVKDFHATRYDLQRARFWDVISESGSNVGVFDWLVTWPPDRLNGFVVPAWLAHGPETWPPEIGFICEWGRQGKGLDLEKAREYGLTAASEKIYQDFSTAYPNIPEQERMFRYRAMELPVKTDLFLFLRRKYDPLFTAYVTTAADHVSHLYWKFYEPEKFRNVTEKQVRRFGDFIPSIYREIDSQVGRLLAACDSNTAVIVLSDHGFHGQPNIDAKEIRVEALVDLLGWKNITFEKLGGRAFLHFSKSVVNRDEAVALLKGLKIAETGEPVFFVSCDRNGDTVVIEAVCVMRREDVTGHMEISGRKIPASEILADQPLQSGDHDRLGILILNGPPFLRGTTLKEACVRDIAPTVMALLGYPLAGDFEGKLLKEAFHPEFLAAFPPRRVETYGPPPALPGANRKKLSDDEKEKLKSVGYL